MDKLRHLRRQMVQQTLQAVGVADETNDEEFKSMLAANKANCDQLALVHKNLGLYKKALADAAEAQAALADSLEAYFDAAPGSAGGVADPTSLLLARALSAATKVTRDKDAAAAGAAIDTIRASLGESHARYGGIAARVETRKAALLEFDAYKRKVEALRAAPPKNDPDKLPRNEEKLATACADLAKANDELISKLVELEKAKPAMVAAHLPAMVAAGAAFYNAAGVALEPVLAKAAQSGDGGAAAAAQGGSARKGSGGVAAAENPFGTEDEPPVMSFTPSVHLSVADEAPAPAHAFPSPPPPPPPPPPSDPFAPGGAADDDDFGGFGSAPPPPPPPFPPPAGGAGGVPGVDDFDNF